MQFKEDLDEDVQSTSPAPAKLLSFQEALIEMLTGKKVTKLEWGNSQFYGHITDGLLQITTEKGNSNWIIRDVDITGRDYVSI